MINMSGLKNGDKCKIWICETCRCGCESEGKVYTKIVRFLNGVFQSKDYEIFGSSVIKYRRIK